MSTSSPTAEQEDATGVKPVGIVGITPEQKSKWHDTMSMMVWTAPGFQHILYKLLNAQRNTQSDYVAIMSKDMPNLAATDGHNVIVNPDRYFALTLPERVFVLGHEIIHNVFGDVEMLHRCIASGTVPMHDGTSRPFVNDTMQRAMDARINALLIESRIGKAPKEGHFDKEVKGHDSVLDIYKKYYEDEPDGNQPGGQDGPGNNPGGFDSLMKPGQATGQNPAQAAQQRNPQQWGVEIAAAQTIEHARSQGKMAAALKRMFKELLEPEVPWVDHIETLINRVVGDGGIDWTQPEPWFGAFDFFVPASTGRGAGWIVVWGDTSGSRSDQEIASSIAELGGILDAVNPARLTVLWGDAEVANVEEIAEAADLTKLDPRGGGGTDYEPVLDWIAEHGHGGQPDLFIGFTDGYVSHPKRELPYPVIWASSTDKSYPFGQVVRVNKVARA